MSYSQSCPDGTYSFVDDIAPILDVYCGGCHGGTGGFNVSTYANVLAGGNNCGPGVTPGDATASGSSLINKLQWAIGRPSATCGNDMPLGGSITPTEFLAIETWIADGASEFCNATCLEDITLQGPESSTTVFEAEDFIISSQQILAGADISYSAGNEINLQIGFEVMATAEFHAFIGGCL